MRSAFIARQPIFNRRLEAVGCELLFRGHGWAEDDRAESPQRATATVVLNALTELDLQRIVGRKQAWVDVPREFVTEGLARAIPAGLTGLEISGAEAFDDELVEALDALREQGYRLALDGFGPSSPDGAVLDLFDIVKLDVQSLGVGGLHAQIERLADHRCTILADGIATYAERDLCMSAGCELLQGHFFCQPAVAGTRGISANRLALLQVVSALQRSDIELREVEGLIAHDVALSFRMLRYVNSAAIGLRGEVRSIRQALAMLGLENARRWAALSVLASVDDKPSELTLAALTRARFCELAGEAAGIASGPELFTLGLFSVIDALMDTPMDEAAELLPLADDMRDALVERRGRMGELLDAVVARECGERDLAASIPRADEFYLRAVIWADIAAESLFGELPADESLAAESLFGELPADESLAAEPPQRTSVSARADAAAEVPPLIVLRPQMGLLERLLAVISRLFGRVA